MKTMKLRVNPEAINDLGSIKRYIRDELMNPTAADRIINEIVKAYKGLKDFPLKGPELNAVLNVPTDYRYLVCESYYIFYKVSKDTVSVYRIINARRDFIRVLFGHTAVTDDDIE